MSKNKVQFQSGYSLVDFFRDYGTEEQCAGALFKWRWPDGFRCPQCGHDRHCALKSRKLFQCNRCRHQASLVSGTLFEQTKLPLTTWFLAIHLIAQAKRGFVRLGTDAAHGRVLSIGGHAAPLGVCRSKNPAHAGSGFKVG